MNPVVSVVYAFSFNDDNFTKGVVFGSKKQRKKHKKRVAAIGSACSTSVLHGWLRGFNGGKCRPAKL